MRNMHELVQHLNACDAATTQTIDGLLSWTAEEMPNERTFKRRPKIQSKRKCR